MQNSLNGYSYKWATKLAAAVFLTTVSVSWAGKPSSGGAAAAPPPQYLTWGQGAISAVEAWGSSSGAGVTVCVLDTGVQKNHPDLQANILGGINYYLSSSGNSKWDDSHGHGTHIAGIIAAVDNTIGAKGIAYNAKLLIVKVLDNSLNANPNDVAKGVNYCVANGADVINMSFGMPAGSSSLNTAIVNAYNAGVELVASVGDNQNTSILYPAKYPQVISVSSLQQNSLNNWSLSYFSNFSSLGAGEVDFSAPGTAIYGLWNNTGYYRSTFGTGQAAAYVSGVAALSRSSGSLGLVGRDALPSALSPEQQGTMGVINAKMTVDNL